MAPTAFDWKSLVSNLLKTFGPIVMEILLGLLETAPKACTAAFDWRAILSQLLAAILALLNPPAPAVA
jgi:hypothetical protein